MICFLKYLNYLCSPKSSLKNAEVAQLVEHHLAKVRVAGSSLVFRSNNPYQIILARTAMFNYTPSLGGGTGRRAGLKILYAAMRVRVRFPPEALSSQIGGFFIGYNFPCPLLFFYHSCTTYKLLRRGIDQYKINTIGIIAKVYFVICTIS